MQQDDYNVDPNDLEQRYETGLSVSLSKIKEASVKAKQQLMAELLHTKPDESDVRERLFVEIGLVDKVVGQLESIIQTN
jgi:hypothetical protein